jgi:hypothetical protein
MGASGARQVFEAMMRVITVLLFCVYGCAQALAQDAAVMARMKDVSDRYNECVYDSAISQFKPGRGNDINLLAEYAFGSCKTETALLVQIMRQNGFTADQIETVFLDKKTGIKRELRKMVLEAQGFK